MLVCNKGNLQKGLLRWCCLQTQKGLNNFISPGNKQKVKCPRQYDPGITKKTIGSTQVLLCLFPGVLWLWHFLYSVGPQQCQASIYTRSLCRGHSRRVRLSQAGDADSSRAPGLTSGLQGSVNVHRGALLLVPQWQCISSFVFYIVLAPLQQCVDFCFKHYTMTRRWRLHDGPCPNLCRGDKVPSFVPSDCYIVGISTVLGPCLAYKFGAAHHVLADVTWCFWYNSYYYQHLFDDFIDLSVLDDCWPLTCIWRFFMFIPLIAHVQLLWEGWILKS